MMAEGIGADTVFCGVCGALIRATVRFCTSCGASQEQFAAAAPTSEESAAPVGSIEGRDADQVPESVASPKAPFATSSPNPGPAAFGATADLAAEIDGEELRRALIDRHGFRKTPPASAVMLTGERGQPRFEPQGPGAIGELANLPARVDAGQLTVDDSACACVAVSFGEGAVRADEDALAEIAEKFGFGRGSERGTAVYMRPPKSAEPLVLVEEIADAVATAARIEESTRPDPRSKPFSIDEFPVWVTTPGPSGTDGLEFEHVEIGGPESRCESLELVIVPAGGESIGQQSRKLHGALAPRTARGGERVLTTMVGDGMALEAADGTAPAFGSGACMLTDQRLVGLLSARPADETIKALRLKEVLEAQGIRLLDSEDRAMDPLDFWTEADKRGFFLDQAGWIGDDGKGVALAFSAPRELFGRGEIEGGRLAFRLGSPVIALLGEQLKFRFQLLWAVDAEGRLIAPQRDATRAALDEFVGGPASRCRQCKSELEPGSRFCSACGTNVSGDLRRTAPDARSV